MYSFSPYIPIQLMAIPNQKPGFPQVIFNNSRAPCFTNILPKITRNWYLACRSPIGAQSPEALSSISRSPTELLENRSHNNTEVGTQRTMVKERIVCTQSERCEHIQVSFAACKLHDEVCAIGVRSTLMGVKPAMIWGENDGLVTANRCYDKKKKARQMLWHC